MNIDETPPRPRLLRRSTVVWLALGFVVYYFYTPLWIPTAFVDISTPPLPKDYAVVPGEMVDIPAGKVNLGCPEEFNDPEMYGERTRPCVLHTREGQVAFGAIYDVPAFRIDKYEVSAGEYKRCVEAGACPLPRVDDERFSDPCTYGHPEKEFHPINCVGPAAALAYCKWVGKELPTRSQWQRAARGEDGRMYPWGNDGDHAGRKANLCGYKCWAYRVKNYQSSRPGRDVHNEPEIWPLTSPIGAMPDDRSPFGVMDTLGNLMEWVLAEPESGRRASGFLEKKENLNRAARLGGSFGFSDPQAANFGGYLSTLRSFSVDKENGFYDMGFRCSTLEVDAR
jgi:formylglycine-generating enzyme required for sulfatase activity